MLSLALGIGVNISIFGYLNAALFKPLAVERSGELVSLYHRRDHNTVFSIMLAYLRIPMVTGSGANAQQISGELVSPGPSGRRSRSTPRNST